MWFPSKAYDVLQIATESVAALREENAALKAELAATKSELVGVKLNADWLRIRFNDLELQNKGLLEKAYGIKLPVPELMKSAPKMPDIFNQAIFEHQNEDVPYGA